MTADLADHFVVVCTECGRIYAQCRCPAIDKTVRHGVCPTCEPKRP